MTSRLIHLAWVTCKLRSLRCVILCNGLTVDLLASRDGSSSTAVEALDNRDSDQGVS